MDLFTKLKGIVKIKEVPIDNQVFQLHYKVTALYLLGCALLIGAKQHFGDPIDCITRDDVPNKIMDTYCWIHATFTLPDSCNKTVGTEVAHPCVDQSNSNPNDRVYHKYYQWVFLVLTLQAIAFYVPHQFWKAKESRLLYKLTDTFREPVVCEKEKEAEREETIKRVAKYFVPDKRLGLKIELPPRHQTYFYCFALSEVANLINVLLQMYLVNEFLGGAFINYGLDVLRYSEMEQDERFDPMISVFPRMTKCTFHRFGSSGDVQRHDALCILPLNIVNEKIYIVMWFWFIFLALVTSVWLVFRLVTMNNQRFRVWLLTKKATLTDRNHIRYVVENLESGDWFLLSMMCNIMDLIWFSTLIQTICNDLKQRKGKNNHTDSGRSNKKLLSEDILDDSDDEVGTPPGRRRRDSREHDFEGILVEK